jgi:raffinose/stachyose/melibiose transport system substrate-binding protein
MHHSKTFPTIVLALLLLCACSTQPATRTNQPLASADPHATTAPADPAPALGIATAAPAPTLAEMSTAAAVPTPAAEPPTAAAASTPDTETIGGGPVHITWWHISTTAEGRANWRELARTYVAQHPNVSISITVLENQEFKTRLAAAMRAGTPPDIFHSWGGGVLKQYGEAGLAQDLTPALAENGWGKSFHAGPLSLYTFNGKAYGVPADAGLVGFWYNKALFKQAGIEEPPATWAGLLEDVKKLKAAGITPIALGGKDKWPGHYYWAYLAMRIGGRAAFENAYSRKGSFADQPFVDAGVRLQELADLQPFQTGFLNASYSDQMELMANGKAAMELMGQWAPTNNRSVAKDVETYNKNLGFFPFPVVEGMVGDSFDILGGGDGFAIGKNAPKEAIDFVRFLTSVEVQTAMAKAGLAVPPVVKGAAAGLKDPLMAEIQRRTGQTQYYQLYYDQYLPLAVGQAVNDSTQALLAGSATPEQVAKTIEEVAGASLRP